MQGRHVLVLRFEGDDIDSGLETSSLIGTQSEFRSNGDQSALGWVAFYLPRTSSLDQFRIVAKQTRAKAFAESHIGFGFRSLRSLSAQFALHLITGTVDFIRSASRPDFTHRHLIDR